jgi:hypothetical protein
MRSAVFPAHRGNRSPGGKSLSFTFPNMVHPIAQLHSGGGGYGGSHGGSGGGHK